MKVFWDLSLKKVTVKLEDKANTIYNFAADSIVRNMTNGWRKKHEVVHAITSGNVETAIPVNPMHFPKGKWRITGVARRYDRYRAPLMIQTNAWQMLAEWELDSEGNYLKPTGKRVEDYEYHIHCSESKTTQGCGNMHHDRLNLYRFSTDVLLALKDDEYIHLEVF